MTLARLLLPAVAALTIAGCGTTAGTVRSWLPSWMPGSMPREAAQPAQSAAQAPVGAQAQAQAPKAAPAPAPSVAPPARPGLDGTSWRLIEIAGQPVPDGVLATLVFSEPGRVAGSAGCNGYTGSARLEGGRIALGPLATTRRACEAQAMAFEQRYLAILATAQGLRREADRLLVEGAAGAPLRYVRQP
jgi:heat shock protein HslJ